MRVEKNRKEKEMEDTQLTKLPSPTYLSCT